MLFRKLWRTMGLYKAQFISMIVMIAIGVGVFVCFNMEWKSIEENVSSFLEQTGFADYRVISESGFSQDDADEAADIDGVDAVSRYVSVNVDVKEHDGDTLAMTVAENADVSGVLLIDGDEYNERSRDGIWLSDKYANANDVELGDTLTLQYQGVELKGTVRGLIKSGEHMICVRDESQLMPDYSTHCFAYISPVMYEKAIGYAYYPQLNVISALDKDEFTGAIDDALANTVMILTKDENIVYAGYTGEIDEGKTIASVLPALFLLIAVLTMITTMHRLTAKEKTQIGTLKALGFKDRRIVRHYTAYAFMIGILGTAAGIALGYPLCRLIFNPNGMMGTYLDMPEWSLYMPSYGWYVTGAIVILLTIIGRMSVRKMLRGTAAEALLPYTPKAMKPLAIEKTRLWDRIGFGTKWNLRDIMRHKNRTAMTIFGVIGCMVIVVAAMGMYDTMDKFLDTYFNVATNYASRIYIAESATDNERDELIEKYDGDWSASVSVQLEEKVVSLDVYSTEKDMVRFLDTADNVVEPGDKGAYICRRISEQFDLSEGDRFTVSPYGSDDTYTLTVAGINNSVSENIVITPAYAHKLGLSYSVDSIYTDTKKSDIASISTIKTVQSKQSVIDSFDSFMEIMDIMIALLIIAAVVLGVVVLYNLGTMSYTERYREMATLKVVGFKDSKIGRLLIGQNMWLTLTGMVIGFPTGMVVLHYMIRALASEYELCTYIGWPTVIVSIALIFGVSLLVSLIVARKNKKIDMVEALKGAE